MYRGAKQREHHKQISSCWLVSVKRDTGDSGREEDTNSVGHPARGQKQPEESARQLYEASLSL